LDRGQNPNAALWIAIVTAGLAWMWPSAGAASAVVSNMCRSALLIWAGDEMLRGVNPWRRCLGASVGAYQLASIFQ
jgi:hypothetical protein